MKKKYYNVGTYLYMCNQKRGTELVIAAAVAGAASLAGAGINAASQSSANSTNMQLNKDTLEEQKQLFHEANDFNRLEAQKARQFNAQESALARQFNAQESATNRAFQAGMVEKYMDYNSASSQYQRYLDAGLNPASLAGNVNNQGFSIPSGSAASTSPVSVSPASAAGVPSLPVAHVNPVDYGSMVSNAIKDASNMFTMGKTYQETKGIITDNEFKRVEKTLDLDLKRSERQKNLAQVRLADADANLALKKIEETSQIISNLSKQGEKLEVEVQLANMEKLYKSEAYREMLGKLQAEHKLAKEEADAYCKLVMSEIAKNQGDAAAAYASAQYNKAMASLAPYQRDRLIAEKNFINSQDKQQRIQNYLTYKYGRAEKTLALAKGKQDLKLAKQQQEKLEWENSGFVRGVGIVKDVAISAASIVGTVYGVGAIGKAASTTANFVSSSTR